MIAFDAPQGFRVRIDLIHVGQGFIERIHATESLFEASVASKSDLLRLRAVTVMERRKRWGVGRLPIVAGGFRQGWGNAPRTLLS